MITEQVKIANNFNEFFINMPEQLHEKLKNYKLDKNFKCRKIFPTMFPELVLKNAVFNSITDSIKTNKLNFTNPPSTWMHFSIHFRIFSNIC